MRYEDIKMHARYSSVPFDRWATDPVIMLTAGHPLQAVLRYDQFRALLEVAGDLTDRWNIHDIVVPVPGGNLDDLVLPQSAIVAQDKPYNRICYYEGNVYDWEEFEGYYTKLYHAASRMAQASPTIAKHLLQPDEAVVVARYDVSRGTVTDILDGARLEAWAGETIEEIFGARLPEGPTQDLAEAQLLRRLFTYPEGHLFRTKAGQVVAQSAYGIQERIVLNHDNPELSGYLGDLGWDDLITLVGPQTGRPRTDPPRRLALNPGLLLGKPGSGPHTIRREENHSRLLHGAYHGGQVIPHRLPRPPLEIGDGRAGHVSSL